MVHTLSPRCAPVPQAIMVSPALCLSVMAFANMGPVQSRAGGSPSVSASWDGVAGDVTLALIRHNATTCVQTLSVSMEGIAS